MIDHTFFRPSWVTTFPGLCTIEIPISLMLNICIGFDSKFLHAPTLAKKSEMVCLLEAVAQQCGSGCANYVVKASDGKIEIHHTRNALPFRFEKGASFLIDSQYHSCTILVTSSLVKPQPMSLASTTYCSNLKWTVYHYDVMGG